MNYALCMRTAAVERGPAAVPGCVRHCLAFAWREFIGMLRQLG